MERQRELVDQEERGLDSELGNITSKVLQRDNIKYMLEGWLSRQENIGPKDGL